PSLHFLGRKGNISDRFGEKLSETFVAACLQKVFANAFYNPRFTLLAPEGDQSGCHYTLYFEGELSNNVAGRLDALLRENPHYALCRDLGQLQQVRLARIVSGHEAYTSRQLAAGRKLGDIKPSVLSRETGWGAWFESPVRLV